jgi:tetratricopeptide (TPR) repeat protein
MITGSDISPALYRVLRSPSMARSIVRSALALALALGISAPSPLVAQTARADLAKARTLYNQRQFDDAIAAATQARRQPDVADMAAIVLARAHLERYRERSDPSDLSAARDALSAVRAAGLEPRDQVELILALGQSLFLEDDYGAAAEMLESGLERAASADPALADAVLEWWGSSIERLAGTLSRDPRHELFRRLFAGARDELGRHPTSAAAIYWTAAALRGAGELDRAWAAAVAGWVRSRLVGERAAALRADLDRLVLEGIVPDRVRHLVSEQQAGAESQLKADWELVKEKWK